MFSYFYLYLFSNVSNISFFSCSFPFIFYFNSSTLPFNPSSLLICYSCSSYLLLSCSFVFTTYFNCCSNYFYNSLILSSAISCFYSNPSFIFYISCSYIFIWYYKCSFMAFISWSSSNYSFGIRISLGDTTFIASYSYYSDPFSSKLILSTSISDPKFWICLSFLNNYIDLSLLMPSTFPSISFNFNEFVDPICDSECSFRLEADIIFLGLLLVKLKGDPSSFVSSWDINLGTYTSLIISTTLYISIGT